MRRLLFFIITLIITILLVACSSENNITSKNKSVEALTKDSLVEIQFKFNPQGGLATNQYAIWVEDEKDNLIKTIFVTKFTVLEGHKSRKDSLPKWVKKAEITNLEKEEIDSFTGATPEAGTKKYTWNCTDKNDNPVPAGIYKIHIEGVLFWEEKVILTTTVNTASEKSYSPKIEANFIPQDKTDNKMLTDISVTFSPGNK